MPSAVKRRLSCLTQVLEHYVRCSRTNNHTVREAACTCIAELAAKIDPEAVQPHVPAMLRTVITCMRDDSWPVRSCFAYWSNHQPAVVSADKAERPHNSILQSLT